MFERASLVLVAASSATLVACFEPDLGDGSVRCGEAGCPDGLVCASDGVCHATTGDTDNTVLAVARDKIRLGITAPRDVSIFRNEVYDRIEAEQSRRGGEDVEDEGANAAVADALAKLSQS
jgi:carbon storage regulator CsrA